MEQEQFQAVGEEINYTVENILNSSRKISKILPLSSKTAYTFPKAGATEDITFEIPAQPFSMKDMYISYTLNTTGADANLGDNGNVLGLHSVLPVQQIYFGTQQRENEFFSISNSLLRTQQMTKLLNKHNWEQNQDLITGLANAPSIGLNARYNQEANQRPPVYAQGAITTRKDFQRAIRQNGAVKTLKVYARLGDIFPMSCFNCSKVLQLGELTRLRMVMSFNDLWWIETNAGAIVDPAALVFNFEITDLQLHVKFEKNTEVVRKLNQVVSSPEGLTVPIIYPYVNTQSVGQSTQQATSFDLTSGQGMRLLAVQTGVFTPPVAGDGINSTRLEHKVANVNSYNIDINNSNIFNYDHTIDENMDYNKKVLKSTPIVDKRIFQDNYFIYQDFTNGEGSRYLECEESQLDESKLVGLPLEKTSYLKYQVRANTADAALEHQHVIYCLRFLNIRESGVSVY